MPRSGGSCRTSLGCLTPGTGAVLRWLADQLPQALAYVFHRGAARMVAGSRFRAAIASRSAGKEHGLGNWLVGQRAGNRTRFLLLHGENVVSRGCGQPGVLSPSQCPGALLKALACLAEPRLNAGGLNRAPRSASWGIRIFR